MSSPDTSPYGSWASPISAELVASGGVRLAQATWSGDDLYWGEGRPSEGGRTVIVRRPPGGAPADAIPAGFNARTLVHEYGGGASWLWGTTVFFTNFADQRLYRVDPGNEPRPITAEPPSPRAHRYADGVVTPDGATVICVRERHETEVINEIVALPADGSGEPVILAGGHDFFSFPRLSPDGSRLAWTSWDHPQMPWDGTELWVADLLAGGALGEPRRVAGGVDESIFQPSFSPDGTLHFISDRSGWWNLYADRGAEAEPLAPEEAEFAGPQWVFALSTYTFLPDGTIVCLVGRRGGTRLCRLDATGHDGTGHDAPLSDLGLEYRSYSSLTSSGTRLAFIAGSPVQAAAVVTLDSATGAHEVVRRSLAQEVDPAFVSVAEPISFPSPTVASEADPTPVAHALYYRPVNPNCAGPEDERPPLVVMSHGGPTSATSPELRMEIQYFTSRGFAIVDVNYGGSTGYGRAYRDRLKGRWGVLDVDDCIGAATFLAARGDAAARRRAIRGGSAGGYTTLCALTFHDTFAAGASYYGVADAETLARDTHKFESRYLDSLIGPYPEDREVYWQRSPVHFADRLSCPIILLQGLEDAVVPPAQAEEMVAALDAKGLPHSYIAFPGEQHGFRQAVNIRRALEAEAYFYARVFGFVLAGDVPEIPIK